MSTAPAPKPPARTWPIRKVAVLGANGTMGYQSGALFAAAGAEVAFLARTADKARAGVEAAARAVRSSAIAAKLTPGAYDEAMEAAVREADLVFEAVAEDMDLKRAIFDKVEAWRRPGTIVATVTSGLSITGLAQGRGDDFRRCFVGLHFFNPAQVIVGTELVAGADTDPDLVDFLDDYCTRRLGRVIVRAADTPGFAGNRVGFKVLNEVAQLAEAHGPLLMDRVVGPYTGRAFPPLATVDMVGWDVHRAIVDNIHARCRDEAIETLVLPASMRRLMEERGLVGDKGGGGFFRRAEGGGREVLDLATGDYRPEEAIPLPDLAFIDAIAFRHRVGDYRGALARFAAAGGPEAALARKVIAGYVSYALHRAGEVATREGIDLIMAAGFNWAPPGVLVDLLGPATVARMMEEAGVPVPPIVEEAARTGRPRRFFTDPRFNVGKFFIAR